MSILSNLNVFASPILYLYLETVCNKKKRGAWLCSSHLRQCTLLRARYERSLTSHESTELKRLPKEECIKRLFIHTLLIIQYYQYVKKIFYKNLLNLNFNKIRCGNKHQVIKWISCVGNTI